GVDAIQRGDQSDGGGVEHSVAKQSGLAAGNGAIAGVELENAHGVAAVEALELGVSGLLLDAVGQFLALEDAACEYPGCVGDGQRACHPKERLNPPNKTHKKLSPY